MIKTRVVCGELPFSIQIDSMHGMGITPASATMAALSVGKKIPAGMRDARRAARYIFWKYECNATWCRLIEILEQNDFNVKKKGEC